MYDVMAIGNALVDHEYLLTDQQLIQTGLAKGNMTLASLDEQKALLTYLSQAKITQSKQAGGGSAANAMYALASLGGKPFYGCRVGDDQQGQFYLQDLHSAGVTTSTQSIEQQGVTGSCVVAITNDGERTMQTYLGTSSDISEHNINFDALIQSDWLYLEGYLAMSESIQPAMTKLRQQAGVHNVKIAVSFADPAVVKFAKAGLENMIGSGVHVIFCNSEEALLFTEKKQLKAAVRALLDCCQIAVVTDGANGAFIASKEGLKDDHKQNAQDNSADKDDGDITIYEVATPAVADVIDTNGAGDNYAGTFLYALSQHYTLPECGRLASEVASQVIQQFGPRLQAQQYKDIARRVLMV